MKQGIGRPLATGLQADKSATAISIAACIIAFGVISLIPITVLPAVVNVPADQPTIQAAIDAASDGDSVLVQPGTYFENINFKGKSIILGSLYLTTGDTTYIPTTIIDGGWSGPVVTFNNGEDSTTVITGLTLTNGSDADGGGIKCINAGPTISNVIIHSNTGDGIFCDAFHTPLKGVALSWHNHDVGVQMLSIPSSPVNQIWAHSEISTLSQREDLSAGDIDGDGDNDLLQGTSWLRNDGSSWTTFVLDPNTDEPDRNELVDINKDGRLDAVIGYEAANTEGKVAWYEQPVDPTGLWTEHIIATDVIGPMSLDVADMDRDGDPDIIVGEHNLTAPLSARLIIFENLGDGAGWASHIVYTGDEHHDGARVVDIDSDGDLDILSIGWGHSNVILYENVNLSSSEGCSTDSTTLPAPSLFPSAFPPAFTIEFEHVSVEAPTDTGYQQTASLVMDIDRDGVNDFVISERKATPSLVWYRRTDSSWIKYLIDDEPLGIGAGSAYFDIDSDGDLDIVMGQGWSGNNVWWWENPYPTYDTATPWTRRLIKNSGANKHHDYVFGDFDGDNVTEMAFWNNRGYVLLVAEIPLDPTITQPWTYTSIFSWPSDQEFEGLAAADIDGDGIDDIVGAGRWFKHDVGTDYIENIIDSAQSFTRTAVGQLVTGGRPEVVFVTGDSDGPLNFYQWDGVAWVKTELMSLVIHGHSLDIVDVNRDGNLDIFVAEMNLGGTNPDAKLWFLLGDGSGNFIEQVVPEITGYGNHESRVADLDGDGDIDILGKPYNWNVPRLDIWLHNDTGRLCLDDWQRHVVDSLRPSRAIFIAGEDLNGDNLKDIISGAWWYSNPGIPGGEWVRNAIGSPLNNMAVVYDFDEDGDFDILGTKGLGSEANASMVWAENDGVAGFVIHDNIEQASGDFLQGVAVAMFEDLNAGGGPGGPPYSTDSLVISIANSTIYGNSGCGVRFVNCSSALTNTILWANSSGAICADATVTDVTYCDVSGGWEGEGNIDSNPMFCGPFGSDFSLSDTSPCIGSGEGGKNMGPLGLECTQATQPVVSNCSLDASTPLNQSSDDLICSYDLSGTATTAATTWYRNGSPLMALYLPMEGSSSLALDDFSGNELPTTGNGGLSWDEYGDPNGSGALRFDGTDDVLMVPDHDALDVDHITLAAWIYLNSYQNDQRIISKEYGTSQPYSIYSLVISGSAETNLEMRLGLVGRSRVRVRDNANIPLRQWVHVAGTFDGSRIVVYVNGKEVAARSVSGVIRKNNEALYIGGSQFYDRPFDGMMDDVGLYPFALSPEQILAHYNSGRDVVVSRETDVGDEWQASVTPFSSIEAGAACETNVLTIFEQSTAPLIASTPVTAVMLGQPYTYDVEAAGSPIPTYELTLSPDGMTIDNATGLIEWTPPSSGIFDATVVAANAAGSDTQVFSITVAEIPVITSTPPTDGIVGQSYSYDTDASGFPSPVYALTVAPDGMSIDSVTGEIAWTPTTAGDFDITASARNPAGTVTQDFSIKVEQIPVITSAPSTEGTTGVLFTYDVEAIGLPQPVYALILSLPGMTIDTATGVINWTPVSNGDFGVTVEAVNGVGADSQSFTINVSERPVFTTTPSTDGVVGQLYAYDADATGIPAPLYALPTAPDGMSVDSVTGEVEWTPATVGDFDVSVTATSSAGTATQDFTVSVNEMPAINSTPQTDGMIGQLYAYDSDASGSPAPTYGLATFPAGMSIDSVSGMINWTPVAGQEGSNTVVVEAVNTVGADTQSFSIDISEMAECLLSATSSENLTTDDLICTHGVSGAEITAATAWQVNGSPQMALYMPMEGGATNAMLDYSGHDNHATPVGTPLWNEDSGHDGFGALTFDDDDHLIVPDAPSLDLNYVTLAAWIYLDSYQNDQRIITKEYGTIQPYSIYTLLMSGPGESKLEMRVGLEDRNRVRVRSSADVPLHQWVHVAATFDGSEVVLFINGQIETIKAVSGVLRHNDKPIYVGCSQFWAPRFLTGKMDDIRIYGHGLSAEQVNALYNVGRNVVVAQETMINDEWQAIVTPFTSDNVGVACLTNILTIQPVLAPSAGIGSDVPDESVSDEEFLLSANFPNPFNPSTEISFVLPNGSAARLEVFNIRGRLVETLLDSYLESGQHYIVWDAGRLSSGVYFYRLSTDDFTATNKMILLK